MTAADGVHARPGWRHMIEIVRGALSAALLVLLLAALLGAVWYGVRVILPRVVAPYAVGTSRLRVQAAPAIDVRLWYPAARAPLRWREALADAPLAAADRPFPVLLYFPGWPETGIQNGRLIDALVRQGYVVASVGYPQAAPGAAALIDFSSESAYAASLARADARVRAHARDAGAVLDALAQANAGTGRFAARLDLQHAGILGYSFGGAVAAQAAWSDARLRAVINLDGWQFADAAREGVAQPYLLVSDDALPSAAELASPVPQVRYPAQLTQQDYERSLAHFARHGGYLLVLRGTHHAAFADAGLSIGAMLGGREARVALQSARIVERYATAFFDRFLRGRDAPLLAGAADADRQVHLQHWPAPATDAGAAEPPAASPLPSDVATP